MKNKKNKSVSAAPKPAIIGISKVGRKVICAGCLVLIAGYFILTKTDPAGQNWASVLSPFLILGGYTLIGIGIIVPERAQTNHS